MGATHARDAGTRVRIHAPASYAGLKRVHDAYQRFADRHALPDDLRHDMYVAVEELVSNVIRHGSTPGSRPRITVGLACHPDTFTAMVSDGGPPFNPLAVAPPDTTAPLADRSIGGLGILLVKQLTDDVRYRRRRERNHVRLVKRRPAEASATA